MQNSNRRSIRLVQISLCLLCQLAFLTAATLHTHARNGLPQSAYFGFGARIDPWGEQVDAALEAASANGLDWIGLDFDWNAQWPESNTTLDLAGIDHIMQYASNQDMAVLISITNAPSWAMSSAGPDPDITGGLIAQFIRLYPNALKAVELFPGANTAAGWGAPPDPAAYTRLVQAANAVMGGTSDGLVLISAGLIPVSHTKAGNDIDELEFLQQLYEEGAASEMPVISVRFPNMYGDPLEFPRDGGETVLRRYELIRKRMLQNGHKEGLIWVTGFSWPAVDLSHPSRPASEPLSAKKTTERSQSNWLGHALQLMKSQLYLGAAFHDCLNPPIDSGQNQSNRSCLIRVGEGNVQIHPALTNIGYMNELVAKQQSIASSSERENASARFNLIALWKALSP